MAQERRTVLVRFNSLRVVERAHLSAVRNFLDSPDVH
jgi:hypothetical protein